MKLNTVYRLIGAGILAYALAACNGSSGSNGGLTPPGVPQGASRVYLACQNCGAFGQIVQYLTPISNANLELNLNMPAGFPSPDCATVDPSGSRLFVGAAGGIVVYNLPLTSTSTPFFTIAIPGSQIAIIAFDPAGHMYAPDAALGKVYVFNPPVTSASTPAVTHTGYSSAVTATGDAAGNVYVADETVKKIFVYSPPFTSSSAPTVTLGAANGLTSLISVTVDPFNRLAVADQGGGFGIRFFNLPVTATSTPVFSVVSGVNTPSYASFDYLGNMYVTNDGATKSMTAYSAPLTAASTPTATVTAGFTNANNILGSSFGP